MTKTKVPPMRLLPKDAHISDAGTVLPIAHQPAFAIAWRCYPNVALCWQIVTVNGQQVYIACDQIQPGVAAQQMQRSIIAWSEQEADQIARQMVQEKNRLRVWRPGDQ